MIYTFYSFKGGVGRSMAMAGVAYLFAQRGLKVLAIDFDLEAPGLERYFFDGERSKRVRAQPGLIDLILDYRAALASEAAFNKGDFRNWRRYCTPAIHATKTKSGSVDLMTAGCREPESALRNYALAVRSFDWQDFFYNAKGDLFFDWLRRRLLEPGEGYDVVLVDSRTGVTEMGGVCAYQLADVAVLLCAANFQNLEGTRDVARDFRSESVRALRLGRPLEIVAIPARIESEHPGRAEFLARFKDELGVDGLPMVLAKAGLDYEKLAIPYLPAFAVAERLVGEPQLDRTALPPVDVFERLTDALTLLALDNTRLHAQRDAALERLTGAESAKVAPLLADATRSSAGYDAFIDFAIDDLALVSELSGTLEKAGFRTYMDQRDLQSGASISGALDHALEYSHMLLVAFGRPTQSEWRAHLIARARRLQNITIVPLLLPGSDPGALASFDLSESKALDLRDWPREDAQQRLVSAFTGLLRQPQPLAVSPDTQADPLPYVGDRAYGEDDAAFFFGRDEDVQQTLSLIESHSVVCLTGPARVGKTSLVHAGVVPKLRLLKRENDEPRFRRIESMDLSIVTSVEGALETVSRADVLVLDAIDSYGNGGGSQDHGRRIEALRGLIGAVRSDCLLILVARDVLVQPLRDAVADIFGAAMRGRDVAHLHVDPMSREALVRGIEGPAERAGHLLEPGLTDRLIEGAGAAKSGIAQIQQALVAIWHGRKRGWLTNKSLDAVGQLDGLTATRLRAVLAELEPDELAAARALILRLVTLSGRRELVPAPQGWEPLATVPLIEAVDSVHLRDRLVAENLIDVYREGRSGAEPGEAQIVLVALARANATVYFDDAGAEIDLKYLLWRDALAPQLRLWRDGAADALLRGATLIEAEQWLGSHPQLLTGLERNFLQDSLASREQRTLKKQELLAREQQRRELNERDRLVAAEQLAAESAKRADVEARAKESAEADAKRLRLGTLGLVGLLLVSIVFLVAAITSWKTTDKLLAGKTALQNETYEALQLAHADRESMAIALEKLQEAGRAQDRVRESAKALDTAAESALNAADGDSRRLANAQLNAARNDFIAATASISQINEGCPSGRRLYLQIADEADRAWARDLVPVLQKAGFIVPGIEWVKGSTSQSEVRYFRKAEQKDAVEAVRVLRDAGLSVLRDQYVPGHESSDKIRPCHYEAWFAAGASKKPVASSTGNAGGTTVRYYRDSDRDMVQLVAGKLALKAEKGASRLAGLAPNALVYSSDIPAPERIAVAITFVEAGFPLVQMSTAQRVADKKLVQVIASAPAQQRCGRLTVGDIRAGKTCGGK